MYLITGANGQLGKELQARLGDRAVCADIGELDITDTASTLAYVAALAPDVIFNCAAYTAVDKAEAEEETALRVNADGPANLALAASKCGAALIHISTDYVFEGTACRPYLPDDAPGPRTAYGRTKLEGERRILATPGLTAAIVRTAWLYSTHGANFVKTMMRLGRERASLNVVADQIGTPTHAGDLADALIALSAAPPQNRREIYHFTNEGVTSWYDFAVEIMRGCRLECQVNPIRTKDYPTPAKRPPYSVLDKGKIRQTLPSPIRHWREALEQCLNELATADNIL